MLVVSMRVCGTNCEFMRGVMGGASNIYWEIAWHIHDIMRASGRRRQLWKLYHAMGPSESMGDNF